MQFLMMKKRKQYYIIRLPAVALMSFVLYACANIGNPNGGPYDETPPRYVKSKPEMNQLNFKGNKIEIWFNEYISLDNPNDNVIITPPQKQMPFIQDIGKKIIVELKDTMIEETTYTIDFTSSIVDYNEKNALENFSFAFSTGNVLDTLQISGVLINAENKEVVQKMLVGIHSNLSDTAFTKTQFLRTSKTDDQGRFVIKNISPGSYHVFALDDKNRNYAYDKNSNEGIAFLDSIFVPSCERVFVADTIWKDSLTIDTIMMFEQTKFYPNDLVLWFFRDSVAPRQRILRPERTMQHIITLKFNAPMDTFPKLVPLNFEPVDSMWFITQKGEDKESFALNYWILDSMIYKKDTLQVELFYWKNNDSIPEVFELQLDTLSIAYRAPQPERQATRGVNQARRAESASSDSTNTEREKPPAIPLQLSITPVGSLNPYDVIRVMTNEPVLDVHKAYFLMEIGVDSLWEAVDFDFEVDTAYAMSYLLKRDFKYNERYRVTIDSAMLTSVYGLSNNPMSVQMTVKGEKDYCHIIMSNLDVFLEGDSGQVMPAFVELLSSGGALVRKATVENGVAAFMNLNVEKYFARIILDANGNGRWDAGNYEEKRQPERIIYLMKKFETMQNFTYKEDEWDISKVDLRQKPDELVKIKSKEQTKIQRDYREESKPQNRNSTSTNIGGLRF